MKKKGLSLLLILSLLLTLASCGSSGDSPGDGAADEPAGTEEDGVITLRSCFSSGMTSAVNRFAIEKGLYEEYGIRFEDIQNGTGGHNDTVLSLISRGEIDIADGDPSTYIPGIQNGVPAKLVGNMWRYSGCFWLIARNDIASIADLAGKTIGTSAASGGMRLSVLKMLESAGLTEDDVTLVANGSYQDAYASFTTGEVDATIIHNPYAVLAEEEGIGHALGRAWDYIPDYYTGTIIASNDIIENNPEALQKFLTAYYAVHEQVKNEYFDEFIQWGAEEMNTDPTVFRKAVESEIDVWLDYPVIPVDRVQTTLEILREYGWLEEDITDLDSIIDNSFAEKAAEELDLHDPYAE